MSQELSIYLKPKKREGETEEPKLLFLTSYTRSSNVYEAITDAVNVGYCTDDDEKNKTEITPADMDYALSKQKEAAENVAQMLGTRKEILAGVSNTEVADDIISDIDRLIDYQKEINDGIKEVEHLSYLINTIYTEREYSWSDFEKVLADIG